MIYLDNAATTRPLEGITAVLNQHIGEGWQNPSALYPGAAAAQETLKENEKVLCSAVGASRMILTSCGTEGANTAILRGYRAKGQKKLHFITSSYEHPAVYQAMRFLEEQGHSVCYVAPREDGIIHPEDVAEQVGEETALVSIMHVNNETGAQNPIEKIAAAVKRKNPETVFHSDGVQGYVKCPIALDQSQIDYYTVSAHKLHALKGTGALFYRKGAPLKAYLIGGGQESGLRSGTENTFGAAAFAYAVGEFMKHREEITGKMAKLRETLAKNLRDIPCAKVIEPASAAPHILAVSFEGIRGETLLHMLEEKGIYISMGSACSSKKRDNRIAKALRLTPAQAEGMVRISFSAYNTQEEMEITAKAIEQSVAFLSKYTRK